MFRSIFRRTLHFAELSFYVFVGVLIATLARAEPAQAPRVLTIGDSLMAFHAVTGRNVSGYLERSLGAEVTDRSVLGAHMVYRLPITGAAGLSIPKQFRGARWDWVVMTGGAMTCGSAAAASPVIAG